MTKNGLAPEAVASEPPSKRQKLASPCTPSSTTIPSQHSSVSAETSAKMAGHNVEDVQPQAAPSRDDEQARELKAGISQFVNPNQKGFSGVLKQRYTDFMVNEILLDGSVLHLLSDRAPKFDAVAKNGKKAESASEPHAEPQEPPKQDSTPEISEPTTKTVSLDEKPETVTEESPIDRAKAEAKHTETETEAKNPQSESAAEEAKPAFLISAEDDVVLEDYFGAEFKTKIIQFHEKILAKPTAKPAVFGSIVSEPFTDRVRRGKLHGDVRRIFRSRLETTSIEGGNIKISAASQSAVANHGKSVITPVNQGGRGQRVNQAKGKLGWEELGGQYLHFTLFKENKDTMEVIAYLARTMRIKPKDFAFSGTKDRRAVTAQRVSIFRQHARDLARLNPSIRQARIGDFKYEKHPLKLGELNGNFFTISLRDCHFDGEEGLDEKEKYQLAEDVVGNAVKHFQAHGFINYFGLQRFGTFSISNDLVGTQILNGNFEGAIKSILHYNPHLLHGDPNTNDRVGRDDIARARAIHEFEKTGQSKIALEQLPKRFNAEQSIIRHLGNRNTRDDYIGALRMINRNLKTMYVHAYQSLIWNAAASERWIRYGGNIVEGDLIIIESGDGNSNGVKEQLDENGEIIVLPAEEDSALQADNQFERARPLSAQEAASGKYTIFDIVLPTPGFDVEYPQNDIGDFYKEFMGSKRGGGLDPADMRRSQKDFSLSGNYRKILARAEDLSFQVKIYHGDTEQLTETDLDILDKNRSKDNANPQRNGQSDWFNQHGTQNNRGGRGGFSNNRGGYGQNNRGRFNDSATDDGSRFTRDVRFEDPNFVSTKAPESSSGTNAENASSSASATEEEKKAKHDAALSAWNAFPAKLQTDRKEALEAAEARQAIGELEEAPASCTPPVVRETFVQTAIGANGRREIVSRQTSVLEPNGDRRQVFAEDLKTVSSGNIVAEPVKTAVTAEPTEVEVTAALQDSKADVDASFTSTDSQGGVYVEPKLAVIIKFALGTSQYATMALRELLKAGGLTPYKPDFSLGR